MRHQRHRGSKAHGARATQRIKSQAFEFDRDLRWFFVVVGKGGERSLRSPEDLRRWLRLQRALTGLWRLCLYFTNPRGFARPLLSSIVEDEGEHGASWLYGLSPDQRAERFHREDRQLDDSKLYAMRDERRLTHEEAYAVMGLDKEYERYRARIADPHFKPTPTVEVPQHMLWQLVRPEFESGRKGEYPHPTSGSVLDDYIRLGHITRSVWLDYLLTAEAARQVLHKRREPGVASMSDGAVIKALKGIVDTRVHAERAEEQRLAAEARAFDEAAAARRQNGPRNGKTRAKIDWLSTETTVEISVAEIARVSKLSQKRVRELIIGQGCPAVTLASGEPPSGWLNSDAGRALKSELTTAIGAALEARPTAKRSNATRADAQTED